MRVLIIEDDDDLRETLAGGLRDAGHEVDEASDGARGWERLERDGAPDAIVLDLMMPNMDGRAFRRRQLEHEVLASVPTLVLTATTTVDASTRQALGATPVLHKPAELDVILAALVEVAAPPHETKACACGREYDRASWADLPLVGVIDNGRDVGERFELRQCVCHSTIAWHLGRHALSVAPPTKRRTP